MSEHFRNIEDQEVLSILNEIIKAFLEDKLEMLYVNAVFKDDPSNFKGVAIGDATMLVESSLMTVKDILANSPNYTKLSKAKLN